MSDRVFHFGAFSQPEKERRKESRFLLEIGAQLIDSTDRGLREPIEGRVLDVSQNGLKLRIWHDAPIGARFSISLQYNEDDSLCMAEVMWKRESTIGMIYGLRVTHWTYLTPLLASEMRRLEIQKTVSDLEMDMQDVTVPGDIVFPFHTNLALRSQRGF